MVIRYLSGTCRVISMESSPSPPFEEGRGPIRAPPPAKHGWRPSGLSGGRDMRVAD